MNEKSVGASYCPLDFDNSKYNIFDNRYLHNLLQKSIPSLADARLPRFITLSVADAGTVISGHTALCERHHSFSQVVGAAAGAVNYNRPEAYASGLARKYRSAEESFRSLGTDELQLSSRAVIFSIIIICLVLASCTAGATRQQDTGSNNQTTVIKQALSVEPADSVAMFGSMLTLGRHLALMRVAAELEAEKKARQREKGGIAP